MAKSLLRIFLFALGILGVAAASAIYLAHASRYSGTDDAYIKAHKVMIAPEVAGKVLHIHVQDNQHVKKGDPLLEIDPEQYHVALANAKANLANTITEVQSLRSTYRQRQAELERTRKDIFFYKREYERQKALAEKRFTSETQLDTAHHSLDSALQNLQANEHGMQQILDLIGGSLDLPMDQVPMVQVAQARCDQAALDLRRTVIKAPMDGVVTQVSALRPGDFLGIGQAAFPLVDLDHPWVEANMKEIDLAHVRVGQPATVAVDTYGGEIFQAEVESFSPASGAEFSILPPQNTSGNWVKVVQRIPLRLSIKEQKPCCPLKAGMSVVVSIDTGHTPHWVFW